MKFTFKKKILKLLNMIQKSMDRYLENDISNEEIENSNKRFNTEKYKLFLREFYNCLNFQDLLNNLYKNNIKITNKYR